MSVRPLIALKNPISLSAYILILSAYVLIVFENRISLSAQTLILSAHALIAFENRISLSTRTLIASTLPSNTACSPTVPGGDTPCLTAGDARRANPWTDDSTILRRRRRRTAAHFCTPELPLHAFSAPPPEAVSSILFSASFRLCSAA